MTLLPAKLIVVEDVFDVGDLLLFTPPVPYAFADHIRLRAGDRLELRRPDGTVLQTSLYCIGRHSPSDGTGPIGLRKPPNKADVPIGTEIWKVG
jgi:hypothetical protein